MSPWKPGHPARLLFTLILLSACAPTPSTDNGFDVVIAGGHIVDGTGAPWYRGDVGIRGGSIAAIGNLAGEPAGRRIDATGLVVAPGFIDMMGATTVPLLTDSVAAQSKTRQGITTMMSGEGGSDAPMDDRLAARRSLNGVTIPGEPSAATWRTLAQYFELLERVGLPLNVVHNVGATQVREMVLGEEDRTPTPEQLDQMKALVNQAMADGAVGVSTALIYPPATYAKTDELIELSKVAAAHGGVYFSHMRNESNQVLDAISELITIGEKAGIPVHVYHLKAAGKENWPLMSRALDLIRQARERGVDVTADIYPYIRNGIGLGSFIHPRHYAKGDSVFLAALGEASLRAAVRYEIERTSDWENWYRHVGKDWDKVLIAAVGPRTDTSYVGLTIAGVAKKRGVDVWQAFFDLVQERGTDVNPQSMDEGQKQEAMRAPFVMFDTDAGPTNPAKVKSTHPRAFGTFPRILGKYVREDKVIPLEEAIRKMTSLPANRLGLHDRGRLSPGQAADIVVFNPATVADKATFTAPLQYPVGIDFVMVNGKLVVDGGIPTANRPGKVLRNRSGGQAVRRSE